MIRKKINNIFLKKRINHLDKKIEFYKKDVDTNFIENYQLKIFNKLWQNSISKIPFYNHWKQKFNLPIEIDHISRLNDFPKINKSVIQNYQDLIFKNADNTKTVSTGGSTGAPTKFPSSSENIHDFYSNTYLGRSWWGIKPFSRTILLWGHSHLLGTGITGVRNNIIRNIKDQIISLKRLNAYNMTQNNIVNYYENIKSFNPEIIIGYASCIYRLAEFVIENKKTGHLEKNLKLIVTTAEIITPSEITKIKKAFRCNIAIEYGMAETGVIAHSKNYTENLSVFWDSFYHFVDKSLILTTLKRDSFPLINYDTEDIVELNPKSKYLLNLIQGRSKDIFFLKQKNSKQCYEISGIFFVHVLKNIQGILSVYLKQITESKIEIKILSKVITSEKTIKDLFIKNSKNDFPQIDPDSINIILIEESILTKSGKELYNLNYLDASN